jgi:WD40 repeat protein
MKNILTIVASLGLLGLAWGQGAGDGAVLDLDVPEGTRIVLDGKDYGVRKRLNWGTLPAGKVFASEVKALFKGGSQASETILIQRGAQLRLPLRDPGVVRPQLLLQTGHAKNIIVTQFSPDGRYLLTGGHDNRAILWDAQSGQQVRVYPGPGQEHMRIESLAFSADGKRLALGTSFFQAALYQIESGVLLRTIQAHTGAIENLVFTPDGKRLLTTGDNSAKIWNIDDGKLLRGLRPADSTEDTLAHQGAMGGRAFSPDGRWMASGSGGQIILWDAYKDRPYTTPNGQSRPAGGYPVREFLEKVSVNRLAFSPDGKRILAGYFQQLAIVWDLDGKKLHTLAGLSGRVNHVSFSGDGKRLLTAADGAEVGEIVIWDAGSGQRLRRFEQARFEGAPSLSSDGKRLAIPTKNAAQIYDVDSGNLLLELRGVVDSVNAVAFRPDGARFLIGAEQGKTVIWDPMLGRPVHHLAGEVGLVIGNPFSPDGKRLVTSPASWTNGPERKAILWDADAGKPLRTLPEPWVNHVAYAPDGKNVATASTLFVDGLSTNHNKLTLWDPDTGTARHVLPVAVTTPIAFSANGRRLVTGSGPNGSATVWDVARGNAIRAFRYSFNPSFAFSPAGHRLFVPEWNHKAEKSENHLRDVDSGAVVQALPLLRLPDKVEDFYSHTTFSPDGKRFFSHHRTAANLFNGETGAKVASLRSYAPWSNGAFFSPDSKLLLLSYHRDDYANEGQSVIVVHDAETGVELRRLRGLADRQIPIAFSPDSKRILTGADDGSARLIDIATGQQLATLITLKDGDDWLVATPDGLFDGSALGRQKVSFRLGDGLNVVPVDRFFQDFYSPGLLASLWRGERSVPDAPIAESRPPKVRILSPRDGGLVETSQVALDVEASDEGGGVRPPWLLHNGARVVSLGQTRSEGKKLLRTFKIFLVEGENRFEVHSASTDGSWESEPARLTLRYERALDKAALYVVAIGINRYADDAISLRFARNDADALAGLFQKRGKTLYRDVHVTRLLDNEATTKNVREALTVVAKKTNPQDTLVVFLAGHGAMGGQRYYFIPHEFSRRDGKSLEEDIRSQGLPADVIGDWMGSAAALKRVLILDTCNSGAAVGLSKLSRNPFAFRGAVERLSRAQGVFTIAASATGEEAQEVPDLGHGVLTYTLLAALGDVTRGPLENQPLRPSNPERVADVLEWFSFASGQVPRLTRQYFGRAQDVQTSGQGQSFPVLPLID